MLLVAFQSLSDVQKEYCTEEDKNHTLATKIGIWTCV